MNLEFSQASASSHQHGTSGQEQGEETSSQDSNPDAVARTPPPKGSAAASAAATPVTSHATPVTKNVSSHSLPSASTVTSGLSSSASLRGSSENIAPSSPSPANVPHAKEEDITGLSGHRPPPSVADSGLVRGIGRGGLSNQITSTIPLSPINAIPGNGALGALSPSSDMTKRNISTADEKVGASGLVQPLSSPLANRMNLAQVAKNNDGIAPVDSATSGEGAAVPGRMFSPVSGMQWRPGSSLSSQNEVVVC